MANDFSLMIDATEEMRQPDEVPKVNFKIGGEAPTEFQLSFIQKRNFEVIGDDESSFVILEKNIEDSDSVEETDHNATIVANIFSFLNADSSNQDEQDRVEKTVQEEEVSQLENLSSLQDAILTVCNQQAEKCDSTKVLLNRLTEKNKNLCNELSSCTALIDSTSTLTANENLPSVQHYNGLSSIEPRNELNTKDLEVKILTEINQTLTKHVQTLEKNAFPGIKINICSDPQHRNLFHTLINSSISNSIGLYNEICNELSTSFTSMNSCFEKVHDILMECTKIVQAFENLKFFVTCSSSNIEIPTFKSELNDYRKKLLEEQLQIIDSKQIVTKSVRGFDKIWAYCLELERELAIQKDEMIKLKIIYDKQIEDNNEKLSKQLAFEKEEIVKLKINYDQQAEESNKKLSQQYKNLNQEKLQLEKQKTMLKEEKQKLNVEKSSVNNNLQCIMADRWELTLEKKKLADEIQKLADERRDLENLRVVLDHQQHRLPAERLAFHQQTQALYEQNYALTVQVDSLKREQAESLQRETANTELNKSLLQEINSNRKELATMYQCNGNLRSKCQMLETDIDRFNQELVACHRTITELRKKCVDSEAQMEELKFESEARGQKLNEFMSEEKNYLVTIESLYNENNRLLEQQAGN